MNTLFRALPLVAGAVFVATAPVKAADWRISTTYSGTTQYSPTTSTGPTHQFGESVGSSYYFTTPLGTAILPTSLLNSTINASFTPANPLTLILGGATLSDSVWGNAEQSINYTVTVTIRWIGTAPPPSVQKFWFTSSAHIGKTNLAGWTDGVSRETATISDITASSSSPIAVGSQTCTSQFVVGDPASFDRWSSANLSANVTGGYGRFQCTIRDYHRYQFGGPATFGNGKSVTCDTSFVAYPGAATP